MTPDRLSVTIDTDYAPEQGAAIDLAVDNSSAFFALVLNERLRQIEKFGAQEDRTGVEWGSILTEEGGEAIKEINDLEIGGEGDPLRLATELVQVAACALAFVQYAVDEYGLDLAELAPADCTVKRTESDTFVAMGGVVKPAPVLVGEKVECLAPLCVETAEDQLARLGRAIDLPSHYVHPVTEVIVRLGGSAPEEGFQTASEAIEFLAAFIIGNFPGEPSQDQGAVDTAIRLLNAGEHVRPASFQTAATQKPVKAPAFVAALESAGLLPSNFMGHVIRAAGSIR